MSEEGLNIFLVPIREGHHPRPALEAKKSKPVTGRYGTPLPPEVIGKHYEVKEFDSLDINKVDCILIPGGFSPDHLRTNPEVVKFISEAYDKGKIIAAICHGAQVLIEADIVKNKKVTSYKAIKTDLINASAKFVDKSAIKDGNIITGRAPDDLPEFCQMIMKALSSDS